MTNRSDPDAATAMQYLVWALEYIEKTGDLKALHHARLALKALRERAHPPSQSLRLAIPSKSTPCRCLVERFNQFPALRTALLEMRCTPSRAQTRKTEWSRCPARADAPS